jgi:phosphatidylglycerophosphate synthase
METNLSLKKAIRSDFYIALSFGMTYFRIVLIFVASALIFTNWGSNVSLLVTLILLIMCLDYFDGLLFRKSILHSIPFLRIKRRLLDSSADRVVTHIGCISLFLVEPSFAIIYILILLREIILSGYNIIKFSKNIIIYPGIWAKIAAAFVGFTVISFLINGNSILTYFIAIVMVCLSSIAFFEYYFKYRDNKQTNNTENNLIIEIF